MRHRFRRREEDFAKKLAEIKARTQFEDGAEGVALLSIVTIALVSIKMISKTY